MGSIHIMTSDVVGRIAAGEVVERPASVLKELVENSLDAGATRIRVNVEHGGHKLIQVIDNGCGMDRSDAALCLETHATSKICEDGDVGHISTLGFRGEAIPSIASVSRFNIQTRRADDPAGSEVVVDYGAIKDIRDCGCAPGTNIRVAQLFANMPARRKFLKGPETEDGYIEEMMRMLALTRPDVTMVLTLNGREHLRVPGTTNLAARVVSVLGKEFGEAMLPLDYFESGIRIRGFVTRPGFTRSSRREQRVIVNGRAASADTVYFAIRDAFDSLVMKGRYPGAVIYIDIPPEQVDVNVHPTKREVRFREPRLTGQVVCAAIRRALRNMPGGEDLTAVQYVQPVAVPPKDVHLELPYETPTMPAELPPVQPFHSLPGSHETGLPLNLPPPWNPAPQRHEEASQPQAVPQIEQGALRGGRNGISGMRLIGRLGNKYALTENDAHGLVVVNLRAAHQRIIFERLLAGMKSSQTPSQLLLIPVNITLSPGEARFLRMEQERFRQLGFQVEPFGSNSFIITAVPASFPNENIAGMLREILEDLRQSTVTNRQNVIHLAQTACRHAVSANQQISDDEVRNILRGLGEVAMPYTCPNGHPTMVNITSGELEKRFMS